MLFASARAVFLAQFILSSSVMPIDLFGCGSVRACVLLFILPHFLLPLDTLLNGNKRE